MRSSRMLALRRAEEGSGNWAVGIMWPQSPLDLEISVARDAKIPARAGNGGHQIAGLAVIASLRVLVTDQIVFGNI